MWYVNNVPLWQIRNNMALRLITMTKYVNDNVTEQLVANTFFSVDPDIYRHLRNVYNFPEASEDTKEEMKGRLTPKIGQTEAKIVFYRKGRVQGESPTLRPTKLVKVKPSGSIDRSIDRWIDSQRRKRE